MHIVGGGGVGAEISGGAQLQRREHIEGDQRIGV